MRRLAIVLAITLQATSAFASEHLMRINEVLLSNQGDTGSQYVELKDQSASGEPFPTASGPWLLKVYDADAALVGSVTLTIPAADPTHQPPIPNTTSWFVSTAQADNDFGTTGDNVLTVALPTDGQACFESGVLGKIHCLAWGCVNTLAGTISNTSRAASPGDGLSAQRQVAVPNHYFVGAPTPDTDNVDAAETLPFCATDPDAGPAAPDAMPASPDAATASPDANNGNPGDDTGGGDSGCCGVGRGAAGGPALLALATMMLVRRRTTRR